MRKILGLIQFQLFIEPYIRPPQIHYTLVYRLDFEIMHSPTLHTKLRMMGFYVHFVSPSIFYGNVGKFIGFGQGVNKIIEMHRIGFKTDLIPLK